MVTSHLMSQKKNTNWRPHSDMLGAHISQVYNITTFMEK